MFDIGRKFRLRRAVKEAFDNLPIGICFLTETVWLHYVIHR